VEQTSVGAPYAAASAVIRSQCGKTTHFERYHMEWNAAMGALGNRGSPDQQDTSVMERGKALHDIAAKLTKA
jgi:hypothetical protein